MATENRRNMQKCFSILNICNLLVIKLFHIKTQRLMLFIVVIVRNTKIHYVGHMETCSFFSQN